MELRYEVSSYDNPIPANRLLRKLRDYQFTWITRDEFKTDRMRHGKRIRLIEYVS